MFTFLQTSIILHDVMWKSVENLPDNYFNGTVLKYVDYGCLGINLDNF